MSQFGFIFEQNLVQRLAYFCLRSNHFQFRPSRPFAELNQFVDILNRQITKNFSGSPEHRWPDDIDVPRIILIDH